MIFIFPIAGETVSGTASRQYKLAWGKWRQAISRHFSPPRMPVSQSCTSATFNFSLRATSSHHLDSGRIGLLDTWTLQRCQGLVLFLYLSYLAVTLSTLTMQGGPDCRRVPLNRPKLWRLPGCRQDCLSPQHDWCASGVTRSEFRANCRQSQLLANTKMGKRVPGTEANGLRSVSKSADFFCAGSHGSLSCSMVQPGEVSDSCGSTNLPYNSGRRARK